MLSKLIQNRSSTSQVLVIIFISDFPSHRNLFSYYKLLIFQTSISIKIPYFLSYFYHIYIYIFFFYHYHGKSFNSIIKKRWLGHVWFWWVLFLFFIYPSIAGILLFILYDNMHTYNKADLIEKREVSTKVLLTSFFVCQFLLR